MTLCVCGVHRRVRVAPTHGYYAPERGWRQLHSREVSGEQKEKKSVLNAISLNLMLIKWCLVAWWNYFINKHIM